MDNGKKQRVCVVVGGAGGIGAAASEALAEAGHVVVIVDLVAERAEKLAETLKGRGFSAHAARACDATSRDAVEALRLEVEESVGPADILVNLAGIARNDILVRVKDEDFDATLATHLKTTLNSMRTFLPGMRNRGYGRVVNTSSTAARGTFGGASYSAAKGAIEAMSRTAAFEMARAGVTVNCVAPGLINTGIFLTVKKEYQDQSVGRIPMQRAGEASEIAACIRFLASDDASYVTGQTLYACGGLTIGPI